MESERLRNSHVPPGCLGGVIRPKTWPEPKYSIDRSWMATDRLDGETLQAGTVALGYKRSDRWSYAQ